METLNNRFLIDLTFWNFLIGKKDGRRRFINRIPIGRRLAITCANRDSYWTADSIRSLRQASFSTFQSIQFGFIHFIQFYSVLFSFIQFYSVFLPFFKIFSHFYSFNSIFIYFDSFLLISIHFYSFLFNLSVIFRRCSQHSVARRLAGQNVAFGIESRRRSTSVF